MPHPSAMNGTAMRFDAAQAYAKWPYSFTSLFMLTVVWARAIRTCGPIHSWILLAVLALRMGPGLLWAQVVTPQSEPSGHARGIQANSSAGQPGTDAWRQRRDYALLFATNEYATWEPLINPIPDAEAIAAELRDNYGFQAEVVRNPTREQIVSKQRDYSQRKFGEGDQLFIFSSPATEFLMMCSSKDTLSPGIPAKMTTRPGEAMSPTTTLEPSSIPCAPGISCWSWMREPVTAATACYEQALAIFSSLNGLA